MKTAIVLFAIGTLLVGCAKKKEYKQVFKESTFSKTLLSSDPNDPYVYVPSVENTPMNVTASRPYWLGDQKLVIFKFKEKTLEVLEIPTDKRFAQNENNFSPVFKLDIAHKDYRCAEDQYGECSNKEEEVEDANWQSKQFFNADFSKLTVLETNSLPEQLSNLVKNCFSDRGSEVKALELSSDAVNITVERTLSANIECSDVESFEDLRNLTFKVNYHYSFIKLSKLASKNYQPVVYPFEDQNSFGFFTTTAKKLTADNRTTIDSDVTYLNRWNPEAKTITYFLNDAFYEPEMKSILDSSIKAVQAVNTSFTRAGVDLQIKLEDGRGKKIGDLRNSFLVLVKDPQASGIIGYGPSVANPLTGEIIKGQVVMYYGTIRKFIQETYDELVEEEREKARKAESSAAVVSAQVLGGGELKTGITEELQLSHLASKSMKEELLSLFQASDSVSSQVSIPERTPVREVSNSRLTQRLQKEIFSHERIHKHHSMEDMIEEMSRNNMYHESMVNWNSAVSSAITVGDLDLTNAKPWNELSDDKKEEIIGKIMPYVWIPTLVHEFGHNLGLRHNFSGSEDTSNYYSKEESGKLGIGRPVTFSSVMDYSYSSLNQLPIMGKYDLAALAFGYNREIELKDGQIVKMPKATLEEMKQDGSLAIIKEFQFCTDEHVSVNPGCNRFDEGSSLEEIAKHYVAAYQKNYEKRNKRNNRLNFSSFSDGEYYRSTRYTFQGLRVFFEVFDRIKGRNPGLKPEQWDSIESLKDLKAATQIAADFYLDVLKTPSVHCVLNDKKTKEIVALVPLEEITFNAIHCFDDENIMINKELYEVTAQTGKHFNHARGPELRGDIKADPTQLSIRGIWADKLLAMEYLTKRETGISTFDDYRSSFLDHPEFKDQVLEAFLGFMNDKITREVILEGPQGEKAPYEHSFDIGETHNITRSFSRGLTRHLGIKKASTDIRELIFPMVKKNLQTADEEIETLWLLNGITAIKLEPTTYVSASEVAASVIIKDNGGRNGARFVATHGNLLARNMLAKRDLRVKLQKIDRKKLIEIFLARVNAKPNPEEIPEELKIAYEVETDLLQAFLLGQFPEDALLQKLLSIMSM